MVIYKTTNIINGKIYIGKDKHNNPQYLGSGKILKQAISKYGRESFKKDILEVCESFESLSIQEKVWIKKFNSTDPSIGYNISEGGDGGDTFTNNPDKEKIRSDLRIKSSGRKHSCETKAKISKIRMGEGNGQYKKDPWNKGIPCSDEHKLKLKKANKGKFKGIPRSVETKQKISATIKGLSKSETHKQKISRALHGRVLSDDTKRKMSESRKGVVQTKIKCPYCDKIGGITMHRWHFENCKNKKYG